jgi:hypothetical protein
VKQIKDRIIGSHEMITSLRNNRASMIKDKHNRLLNRRDSQESRTPVEVNEMKVPTYYGMRRSSAELSFAQNSPTKSRQKIDTLKTDYYRKK